MLVYLPTCRRELRCYATWTLTPIFHLLTVHSFPECGFEGLITWEYLRCVQELATILGPQSRTQESCAQ